MKKIILAVTLICSINICVAYPENEVEFLFNHDHGSSPIILNTSNRHTYTRGAYNNFYRDDGVEIRETYGNIIETSKGEIFTPILDSNGKPSYYVQTH